mgnify:CR=1 FL=1
MKVNNKILGLGIGLTLGFTTLAGVIVLGTGNSNNGLSKEFVTMKQIDSEVEGVLRGSFYNAKVINNGDNIIVTVADNRDIIEDVDSLTELIKNYYKDYGYKPRVTVTLFHIESGALFSAER